MPNDPKAGAFNLLKNCMNVEAGDTVLLVLEPTDVFYDSKVKTVVQECLSEIDARVTVVEPSLISDPAHFPVSVADAMRHNEHTLFLSRIGDYIRFVPLPGKNTPATSYTQNTTMLGAPYATIDNRLMRKLQLKLEAELMRATHWRIQCPLGTDLHGKFCWPSLSGGQDEDLTVCLFPVATFKPIPCNNAHGQVSLSRWLMPGGAAKLDNADMSIDGVVHAHVKNGHLHSFSGATAEVNKLNGHYDYISGALAINRNRIHSWHVGINPQTHFEKSANDYLDLWSAVSFGSPRYLHFHTCGDEPPGEIAWSVFDPTILIDDDIYWQNGEFIWLQRDDNKALIQACEGAQCLLEPSRPIGLN